MGKETLFNILIRTETLLLAWETVKKKGSSGGVDGMSIQDFDDALGENIGQLIHELESKTWQPQPYMGITIPKKDNERRKLGLLSIRDKVVQQALKDLIEPRFEKIFIGNSYGYRPGKGPGKAIRFAKSFFQNKKIAYVLRLDIDNYFDNIDHEILFRRVFPLIADEEIIRLIQLCVKMGVVNKRLKWTEIAKGVPQGAVLSPLLANFYLHPFDQYILTRTKAYVRYADDFLIGCETRDQAETLLEEASCFLKERLKLSLNPPSVTETKTGIEFLGITVCNKGLSLSSSKMKDISDRINSLNWSDRSFSKESLESLKGIHNYYASVLPVAYQEKFDVVLLDRLRQIVVHGYKEIPNKSVLAIALDRIEFFSSHNILNKSGLKRNLIDAYLAAKSEPALKQGVILNKKLIAQRKREYLKKETEGSELIVSTFGTSLGITSNGVRIKAVGRKTEVLQSNNLRHITIMCEGVSLSSNLVQHCMKHNIGIDFFSNTGQHYGSIMNNRYLQSSLWSFQTSMSVRQKSILAASILTGKMKNQLSLIKYFHKYHKNSSESLSTVYEKVIPEIKEYIKRLKNHIGHLGYAQKMMSEEAGAAELYWLYIKELLTDDNVGFVRRERQGAKDLVNCMLNYGYAILYARVWRLVLYRKLNPCESVIHVPHHGKPTFIYDIIEVFRTQAVDRVVIALIQKHEPLSISDGLLDECTKKLLIANLADRPDN